MAVLRICCLILATTVLVNAVPACDPNWNLDEQSCKGTFDSDNLFASPNGSPVFVTVCLQKCEIIYMQNGVYRKQYNLKILDGVRNTITKFRVQTMKAKPYIQLLKRSHDLLTTFQSDFMLRKYVIFVDLLSNEKRLQPRMYDSFINTDRMDVSDNSFVGSEFNVNTFNSSNQISELNLAGNYMEGTPKNFLKKFHNLKILTLDRNLLSEVPSFAKKRSLQTLSLSQNKIRSIEDPLTFINFHNLKKLNLSYNPIENMNVSIFKPLSKLETIILRGSALQNLPDGLFQDMNNLKNIDLSRNQITKLPDNIFRGTPLQKLDLSNNRITYLSEFFFRAHTNLKVFYFDLNPWQCSCLRSVLNQVKNRKITYNSTLYKGKRPVCVTTKELTCNRDDRFNSRYVEMYNNLMY